MSASPISVVALSSVKALVLCTFLSLMLVAESLASVDKARMLYDARLFDDAKRELIEVAASDAPDAEKAAALHLLGTIAVDEKRYDSALKIWNDLVARFPTSRDAAEVQDKIPLVQALLQQAPATANSGQSVRPSNGSARVIVASTAPTPEYTKLALDEVTNYLVGRGVRASAWRSGVALAEILPSAREQGSTSILILTLKFGYLESMRAECYLIDGSLQWEEKSSGSFGMTKSGVAAGLIERTKEKLEPHVGTQCLPTN